MIIYSIYVLLFFLDICLTGIFQQKILYLLYFAFAYQSVQKNLQPHIFFLFFLLALQAFFDTGIFGIWLLFIIPLWYLTQLFKTFIRNYSILIAWLFSCTFFATFIMYYFYFHYPFYSHIILKNYIFNMALLGMNLFILRPKKEPIQD